jgi:hypothetical protein
MYRCGCDYFTIQHQLIGFYNRDGVCLMRGADWVFKHTLGFQYIFQKLTYRYQALYTITDVRGFWAVNGTTRHKA